MSELDEETLQRILEVKRIRNLSKTGQKEEAKFQMREYLEKNPNDYYAYFTAGRIFELDNCLDEAEYYLLKVVESNSDNKYSAYGTLGRIYENKRDIPKAIEYYNKAMSGPYIETYSIRSLADIYIRNKEYEKALDLISLIKDASPNYYNFEVGVIYTRLGQYEKAKKYLDKVPETTLEGFDKKVFLQKAIVNKCLFKYDKALHYLEKIVKLNSKDKLYYKALYEQANIYVSLEKYEQALEVLEKSKDNPNVKVEFLLGRVNEELGNIKDAKKNYSKSLTSTTINIKNESAYRLGDIYLEEKNYDKAMYYYLTAVKNRKTFPTYIYLRILTVCIRTKNYEEAYKYAEMILENDKEIEDSEIFRGIYVFLRKKFNKKVDKSKLGYKECMLLNYNFNKFYNHINYTITPNKKLVDYTYSFKELYHMAQLGLTSENKVENHLLDTYDIIIPKVGQISSKETDKLRVLTIPNTKIIIDMYPCLEVTLKDKMKKEQTIGKTYVKK